MPQGRWGVKSKGNPTQGHMWPNQTSSRDRNCSKMQILPGLIKMLLICVEDFPSAKGELCKEKFRTHVWS